MKMQSAPFRRLRKQNSYVGHSHRFRVAVFGQAGVGKTAFNVRFITKRFIGDYDPTLESIYQRALIVPPNYPVFYEIMDTPGQEENNAIMLEKIKWADAFVLVYSITDRQSFAEIPRLKFLVSHTIANAGHKNTPISIVGNKNDLDRDRMVARAEGEKLAKDLGAQFYEISVRESIEEIAFIFEQLYRSFRQVEPSAFIKTKSEKSSIDLPIIPHVFSTTSVKKRVKTYKHVNKIPRIQGNPPQKSFSYSHLHHSSLSTTYEEEHHQTERNNNVTHPSEAAHEQDSARDSKIETKYPEIPSSEGTESSASSSKEEVWEDSSESSEEEDTTYEDIDPRKAAEEFAKKIVQLTIR